MILPIAPPVALVVVLPMYVPNEIGVGAFSACLIDSRVVSSSLEVQPANSIAARAVIAKKFFFIIILF